MPNRREDLAGSSVPETTPILLVPNSEQGMPQNTPQELWQRIRRYAPCFVVLPERDEGGLTAKERNRDFHPRVVEAFTDNARLTWGRPIGLRQPEVLRFPAMLGLAATSAWSGFRLRKQGPRTLWPVLAGSVLGLVSSVWKWRNLLAGLIPPLRDSASSPVEIKEKLLAPRRPRGTWVRKLHVHQRGPLLRLKTLWGDLRRHEAQEASRLRAWEKYASIRHDPRYPRAIYVRHVPWAATGGEVLQYWQFYFDDDQPPPATHQADWEVSMVFLRPDASGELNPSAVACSAHTSGFWREAARVNVLPLSDADGWHPLIWIAIGSHSNYFEDGDPPAVLKQELAFSAERYQFVAQMQRGWMDFLPQAHPEDIRDNRIQTERYELRLLPQVDHDPEPTSLGELWDDWWWLSYSGEWGNSGIYPWEAAVKGPAQHGKKWTRPWDWVNDDCEYDARAYWQQLITKADRRLD